LEFGTAESAPLVRQPRQSLYHNAMSPVDIRLPQHVNRSSRAAPALCLPARPALTCKGAELCRTDIMASRCSFQGSSCTDDESLLGADIETLSTMSTLTLLDRRHLPGDPSTTPQIDAKPSLDQPASACTSPHNAPARGKCCVVEANEPEVALHTSAVGREAPNSFDTVTADLCRLVGQESFAAEEHARRSTQETMERMLVDSSVVGNADGSFCGGGDGGDSGVCDGGGGVGDGGLEAQQEYCRLPMSLLSEEDGMLPLSAEAGCLRVLGSLSSTLEGKIKPRSVGDACSSAGPSLVGTDDAKCAGVSNATDMGVSVATEMSGTPDVGSEGLGWDSEAGSVQIFTAAQANGTATETAQVPLAVESVAQTSEFPDWSWFAGRRQRWVDTLSDESDGDLPATTSLART